MLVVVVVRSWTRRRNPKVVGEKMLKLDMQPMKMEVRAGLRKRNNASDKMRIIE